MKSVLAFTIIAGFVILMIAASYRPVIPVVFAVSNGSTLQSDGFYIENPVPPYSHFTDRVLVVDISEDSPFYTGFGGISTGAVYVFEDVFEIYNNETETGFEIICVNISTDMPYTVFFEGDYPASVSSSLQFNVSSGERVGIGMVFDSTSLPMGSYNGLFTIEAVGGACG